MFPMNADIFTKTFEAERASVGGNWHILQDPQASNRACVSVQPGMQSLSEAPAGRENLITIPFTLPKDGTFATFARLHCPTADDYSFWVRMDNEGFGGCTNVGACSAACPKEISLENIARMNRDFSLASLKER